MYCIALDEPSFGKPIQIVYKAIQKLSPYSSFSSVARAEYLSAQELFGKDSKEAKAVKEAYAEVGIKPLFLR